MKQLLFLILFPCLCVAQYTGNAGQKITLGEQTTADGLMWRGRLADTANLLTNKLDTSVYIVLDTGTRAMWYYRASTTPKWTRLVDSLNNMQGQLSLTTKVTESLPVANGGTGQSTLTANKVMVGNGTSGVLTPINFHWDNTNERLGVGTVSPNSKLHIVQTTSTANASGIRLTNTTTSPTGFNNYAYNITQNIEPSSSSSGDYGAMNLTASFNNANVNSGRYNYGFNASAINASTGSIDYMYGSQNSAGSSIASATVTNAESTRSSIYNLNGTITNAYGFRFGGRIFTGATQATIVNAYGLYIDNVDFASTLNYSLYSVGGKNYFGGDVGIGTASPAVQFHTTSNVRFAGLASITDLRTDADGDLFNGSDFNLKNTIDTINFGLSDVLKLKPVSFNWNDEARNINEYKSMGFIAQDIMDVIPNAASTMGDGDMQVDYNAIVATLTKAIQEQQALIKALEQRILILENK